MIEEKFEGRWSDKEKNIWKSTDWKAQNYEDLIIEEDNFTGLAQFYQLNKPIISKTVIFEKHIRPNPIFSPCYKPKMTTELKEFIKENHYVTPMYDGNSHNGYMVMDRFEETKLSDMLSR